MMKNDGSIDVMIILTRFIVTTLGQEEGNKIEDFALFLLLIKESIEKGDNKSVIDALSTGLRLSKKYSRFSHCRLGDYIKTLRGDMTPQKEYEILYGNRNANSVKRSQT